MPRRQPSHPDAPVYVDFPFNIDWNGHAASTDVTDHVRDLLEQILFTSPGERVNRPSFGSGIDRAVFRPNSDLLAETTRVTTEAAIQQWLGHLIQLNSLTITTEDNLLSVEVAYTIRNHTEIQTARFSRST